MTAYPCFASSTTSQYPSPIWASTFTNSHRVEENPTDRRNTPSATSSTHRHSVCSQTRAFDCPSRSRRASENGTLTPTISMNAGWIRSHAETPATPNRLSHGGCSK